MWFLEQMKEYLNTNHQPQKKTNSSESVKSTILDTTSASGSHEDSKEK